MPALTAGSAFAASIKSSQRTNKKKYIERELKTSSDENPQKLLSQKVLAAFEELHREHHLRKFWDRRWPKNLYEAEDEIVKLCDHVAEKFDLVQNHLIALIDNRAKDHADKYHLKFFYQELVLCHLALLSRSHAVKATRKGQKTGLLNRVQKSDKPQERGRFS